MVSVRAAVAAASLAALLPAAAAPAAGAGYLWVPEQMIVGEEYSGVVVVEPAPASGALALLSSGDPSVASVPHAAPVLPHMNHAVFPVVPEGPGAVTIHAAIGNDLYSASAEVFSPRSEPGRLGVTLAAGRTGADSLLAHVGVYDLNGLPVRVDTDTEVSLSTTGGVGAPPDVTIRNGTAGTLVDLDVRGDGAVTASADSLGPGSAQVGRVQDRTEVRVAVAPEVAMPNSYAFYYVWLEKGGLPYSPPYAVGASLQSDDTGVARMTGGPGRGDGVQVRLVDGLARGILYTGEAGYAVITASAAGLGSAQDGLVVGPARLGDGGPEPLAEGDGRGRRASVYEANALMAWAYPPATGGDAWAVVASYSANVTRELGHVSDGEGGIGAGIVEDARLVPAAAGGRLLRVSSDGLEHGSLYPMEHAGVMGTNAIELYVHGPRHGTYELVASARDTVPGAAPLEVVPGYLDNLSVSLVGIPGVAGGGARDIAMATVVDAGGAAVDARDALGRGAAFELFGDGVRLVDVDAEPSRSNSAVIRGMAESPAGGRVSAVLGGVGSAVLPVPADGAPSSLEVLLPGRVHAGEPFPYAAHEVGPSGVPLRRAGPLSTPSPDVSVGAAGLMTLAAPGASSPSFVAAGTPGAAQAGLEGFENPLGVRLEVPRSEYRVGESFRVEAVGGEGAEHELLTEFPFERDGPAAFVVTPDGPSERSVLTVTSSREGYATAVSSAEVAVREAFLVEVTARDSAGGQLRVPVEVSLGGVLEEAETPYRAESGPAVLGASFAGEASDGGRGYAIAGATLNGKPVAHHMVEAPLGGDVLLEAVYDRVVLVSVEGGTGSGVYGYGDVVRAEARERHVIPYLVREVFDGWEGAGPGHAPAAYEFAATDDVSLTATYRTDYTYLMLTVIAPLAAGAVYVMSRSSSGVRWAMQNALDRLVPAGRGRRGRPEDGDTDGSV